MSGQSTLHFIAKHGTSPSRNLCGTLSKGVIDEFQTFQKLYINSEHTLAPLSCIPWNPEHTSYIKYIIHLDDYHFDQGYDEFPYQKGPAGCRQEKCKGETKCVSAVWLLWVYFIISTPFGQRVHPLSNIWISDLSALFVNSSTTPVWIAEFSCLITMVIRDSQVTLLSYCAECSIPAVGTWLLSEWLYCYCGIFDTSTKSVNHASFLTGQELSEIV